MNNVPKSGIILLLYNDVGDKYFLIFHTTNEQKWEIPKTLIAEGVDPENASLQYARQVAGVVKAEVKGKLDKQLSYNYNGQELPLQIYLLETSMNSPITINKDKHDTYLWSTMDRVTDKLSDKQDRDIIMWAVEALK